MREWLGRSPSAALGVAAACLLAAWMTWPALPAPQVERFMGETGPVERVTAKALAATVLLAVIAALAWLLLRHGRAVVNGWRRRRPADVTVVVFVVMLLVAKTLDRSVSVLVEDFGVDVALKWQALRTAIEEWLELGLSLLVGLWLLQHRAAAGD